MKIWYIRHDTGHQRTWGRQNALANAFKGWDFEVIHAAKGLDSLRGKKADIAIVAGLTAAQIVRAQLDIEKSAPFRVYIPSWQRGPRNCKLQIRELRRTKYHVVIPDQTMFLFEYGQAHNHVHYVDRGFDSEIFYPDPEMEKTRGIVFCGNYQAYGRHQRLKKLREAHPGQVEWRRLPYRKLPDYLRSAKVGWNQIMRGPPQHDTCINYRVWETVGCETLLLCSHSMNIPLRPGTHYMAWDSETDMMRKATWILSHDKQRQAIAKRGHEEALSKHTWAHRGRQYREIIESLW